MEKFKNEIRVGGLVLIAVIISYAGFRYMKDLPVLRANVTYYVVYPQVEGLTTGRSIFLNGVDIGKVTSIQFAENSFDSVKVGVSLDDKQIIPKGSKAYLRSIDLLGTKAIALEKGKSSEVLKPGGYLNGVFDDDALGELTQKAISIGDNLDDAIVSARGVLREVDTLMSSGGRKDIEKILSDVNSTVAMLKKTVEGKKSQVEETISKLNSIATNVDSLSSKSRTQIDTLLTQLSKSSQDLDEIAGNVKSLSSELDVLLKKINSGEGTLGKLVNDPSLYNNLDSLSSNMNDIMGEFKNDPKKYLKHMKLFRLF